MSKRILLIVILLLSAVAHTKAETIKVALGEWPPYSSEHLPHDGLLPLILTQAFAYSDIRIETEFMSWQDAYRQTLNGDFDVSPGWLKTTERATDMRFSQAISYIGLRLLHHRDLNLSWEQLEELFPLKLGVVPGYSYTPQLDQAIANKLFKTIAFESDLEAIKAIASKKIDIYPVDAMVASHLLNKLPEATREQIEFDEHTLNYNPIYLISSARQPSELIERFNKGLGKLKETGVYNKILANIELINKIGQLSFYTEDNAPINYQGKGGPAGIMVATIRAILSELGADTERARIEVLPWARAYKTIEKSKNAALFAVTKTEQRADLFKWVGPIYRSNIVLLGLKTRFNQKAALSDLIQLEVCAVIDDVGEQLWKLNQPPAAKLHLVSHHRQCATMLNLGRVDLWVTGKDTARWHLQNNHLNVDQFTEVYQLKEAFRYIAFSKDVDNEIIDSFQKTLNYLQLSGKLIEIIDEEIKKADQFARDTN